MGDPLADRLAALELVNDEITSRLARQVEGNDKIDTKAATLIGFEAAAATFVLVHVDKGAVAAVTAAAYAVALFCAFQAFRPRTYAIVPDPARIIQKYGETIAANVPNPREIVLGRVVGTKRKAFEDNRKLDKKKVRWWNAAVGTLFLALLISAFTIRLGSGGGNGTSGERRHERHACEHTRSRGTCRPPATRKP